MSRYSLGLQGEKLAETYLAERGFRILARRFKTRHGEIDLIAVKNRVLFFVEVKYRPGSRLGGGLGAIDAAKQNRLVSAARVYLADHPAAWQLAYLEVTRAGILFREDILHEN